MEIEQIGLMNEIITELITIKTIHSVYNNYKNTHTK
jgi:hypothetical protein